jgi:signal transduction histidine kinase
MMEFNRKTQVHFSEAMESNNTISPAVALNLFRVCQEGFNNALRHAEAANIHIHFHSNQSILFSFEVSDDGKGFEWDKAELKGHYGLQNMRSRTAEAGALLHLESAPGKGTRLKIALAPSHAAGVN